MRFCLLNISAHYEKYMNKIFTKKPDIFLKINYNNILTLTKNLEI